MRPSRGMGIMNPNKFKKISPKKITRKDDPNEVDVYKKGGGIKSVDKLAKQAKGADSIGRKTPANKRLFAEGGESKEKRGMAACHAARRAKLNKESV